MMIGTDEGSAAVDGTALEGCTASARTVLLSMVAAVVVMGLSACGAASPPTVAHVGSSSTTTAAAGSAGAPGSRASIDAEMLAYARCMRAHGVPNFPDPNGSGGFVVGPGLDRSSSAFQAAQANCQSLLPPGPGSGPAPSAQAMAQMLKVSECMRQHGISDFPDPRSSVPSDRSGIAVISDIDGVILVFPSTLDTKSAAFTQAAEACKFPLHNH